MNILVLNCGSSSVKFALFNLQDHSTLVQGRVHKIGTDAAEKVVEIEGEKNVASITAKDQEEGLKSLMEEFKTGSLVNYSIDGIGHRVVHGGENFKSSCLVDDSLIEAVNSLSHLAPLHNPANLLGIQMSREAFGKTPQVAVFDTAFHQSLPEKAYLYGVPYEWYAELGVRRYGFHGTSHRYVAQKYAELRQLPLNELQFITLHLGNGSSAAAISAGKSVDTTMGMTPLEGLIMGTRSGDIDPGLFSYLHEEKGMSLKEIHETLNKKSGLLGLSGVSPDLQDLEARIDDPQVAMALEVLCYRMARQVLAMATGLSRLDGLIFTGGIGENSSLVRRLCVENLRVLGFKLDDHSNQEHGSFRNGFIQAAGSPDLTVIPTNEELMIALDTQKLVEVL